MLKFEDIQIGDDVVIAGEVYDIIRGKTQGHDLIEIRTSTGYRIVVDSQTIKTVRPSGGQKDYITL